MLNHIVKHKALDEAAKQQGTVGHTADQFTGLFKEEKKEDRKNISMTETFYNLVTDFYEYGWGESFHFAPRAKNESFREGIKRHQHYLALRLGLEPGKTALDIGCGVCGPAREIARFSGANVVAVNINKYQVERSRVLIQREGLDHLITVKEADFHHLPFPDNSFEAVWDCEATAHSPNLNDVYGEVFRVLKPGAYFAGYEWVTTDKYDPENAEHVAIINEICRGNSLPEAHSRKGALQSLKEVGFEIVDEHRMTGDLPWYEPLSRKLIVGRMFAASRWGRWATRKLVSGLEKLHIAPTGSFKVSDFLNSTADALVEGGRRDIYEVGYFVLARKPLQQ